jgi:hypothetical protein
MIMSRRTILASASACGVTLALGSGLRSQPLNLEDPFPPLPADLSAYANQPDVAVTNLVIEQLGTARPRLHEVEISHRIMEGSPFNTRRPIDVARYFQGVGLGKLNAAMGEDVRAYVSGWPVRYNPLIINLFKATRTQPLAIDGDATSWCAAFINWCIARSLSPSAAIAVDQTGIMHPFPSELLKGTDSASSGSFRCWSQEASHDGGPNVGDVLVWAQDGTLDGCKPGPGHVGFYVGRAADGRYLTLGGNQRDPTTQHHAVVQALIPIHFSNSEGKNTLNSIRSVRL